MAILQIVGEDLYIISLYKSLRILHAVRCTVHWMVWVTLFGGANLAKKENGLESNAIYELCRIRNCSYQDQLQSNPIYFEILSNWQFFSTFFHPFVLLVYARNAVHCRTMKKVEIHFNDIRSWKRCAKGKTYRYNECGNEPWTFLP